MTFVFETRVYPVSCSTSSRNRDSTGYVKSC